MKLGMAILFVGLVSSAGAAGNPGAKDFDGATFLKGFDAYSRQVQAVPGGDLMTKTDVAKFVQDALVIARKTPTLSPEGFKDIEASVQTFAAYPYSVNASLGLYLTLSSFIHSTQYDLIAQTTSSAAAADNFTKAAYLTTIKTRLAAHLTAQARTADREHAKSKYPGGPKRYEKSAGQAMKKK